MRFILGVIVGFMLGTTMPNQTKQYTKMFLDKVEKIVQTMKNKLDESKGDDHDNPPLSLPKKLPFDTNFD